MRRKISRRELLGTAAALGTVGVALDGRIARATSEAAPRTLPGERPAQQLPPREELVVRNAWVLTMDPALGDFERGDVHVRGGQIVAVGIDLAAPGATVVDGRNMIALPGLIDTHWHLWNHSLRNLCGDGPDDAYFPVSNRLGPLYTPEDSYRGVRLAAAEALFAGITTVFSWAHNVRSPAYADAELRALADTGLRACFAYGTAFGHNAESPMDRADLARVQREWLGPPTEGLLTLAMAARSPSSSRGGVALPVLRGDWEAARALGLPITMHVSPAGLIEWLGEQGLLGPDVQLVHGINATPADIATLLETGTHMSVCPFSDMRWAARFAPMTEFLNAGVLTSLGFDTSGIAGGADMFAAMHAVAGIERARFDNVLQPTPRRVLQMATLDAARDLYLADRVGSLTPGKRADLILVRGTDLNMAPLVNAEIALVHCAQPHNVDTVIVDGRVVKRGGQLLLDTERIVAEASESLAALRTRAGGG